MFPWKRGSSTLSAATPGTPEQPALLSGVAHDGERRWLHGHSAGLAALRPAADAVIHIRAQTMADDKGGTSVLPMGSLYEAAMLVCFDIVSIVLRERTGQSMEGMRARHTNLE